MPRYKRDQGEQRWLPGSNLGNLRLLRESELSRDDVVADGVAHQIRSGAQLELVHGACAVRLDRLDADIEELGDLLVNSTVPDQLNDFTLAVGKGARVLLRLTLEKLFKKRF